MSKKSFTKTTCNDMIIYNQNSKLTAEFIFAGGRYG